MQPNVETTAVSDARRNYLRPHEIFVLVLTSILFFWPALHAGFVFDDWILLLEQPMIHATDGLRRIWCTAEGPDYYPVTWTVCWLQYRFWGAWPMGYHLVNFALHALNVVVLAYALKRLEIPGAFFAALVFAVHPVNVATVAWISEQKNILAMLFFLLTGLAYLRFEHKGRWRWYAVSLGCFLVSLLAKPAAAMWPILLLGLAWWIRGKVTLRDVWRSTPFLSLSIITGMLAIWFQGVRVLGGQPARTDGFFSRLACASWAVWFYLYKALLPMRLCVIYPRWEIDPFNPVVYLPLALLVMIVAYFWHYRRTWGRQVLAGAGYFVVMLFPVLGFFDQGFYRYSFVADQWQYLPIIGVIALVVGGATHLLATERLGFSRKTAWIAGAIVVVFLGILSWNQTRLYVDDETLWRDTVAKNPTAWLAQYNLGIALANRGQLDGAIAAYNEALRYKPDDIETLNNLGGAYGMKGDLDRARVQFMKVLALNPGNSSGHANLGMVWFNQGHLAQAVDQFQTALRIEPQPIPIRLTLGIALGRMNRIAESKAVFEDVLRLDPSNQFATLALSQLPRQTAVPPRSK